MENLENNTANNAGNGNNPDGNSGSNKTFTQEEVNDAVPFGGCFQNCNTPAELKALEEAVTD